MNRWPFGAGSFQIGNLYAPLFRASVQGCAGDFRLGRRPTQEASRWLHPLHGYYFQVELLMLPKLVIRFNECDLFADRRWGCFQMSLASH